MDTKKINFNWRLWLAILIAFLLLVDIVRADDSSNSYGFTLDQLENDPDALEKYKALSGISDITVTPGELALNIYHSVVSKVGAWSDTVADTVDSWYDDFKNSISVGSDGFIKQCVDVSNNIRSRLEGLQYTTPPSNGNIDKWVKVSASSLQFTRTGSPLMYAYADTFSTIADLYYCYYYNGSNYQIIFARKSKSSFSYRDYWRYTSNVGEVKSPRNTSSSNFNYSGLTGHYSIFLYPVALPSGVSYYTNDGSSYGQTTALRALWNGTVPPSEPYFNTNAYLFDIPVSVPTPVRNTYYTNYNTVNNNSYNSIHNDDGLSVDPIVPVINIPSFNLPTFTNPFPTIDYNIPFYLQPDYYDLTLPAPVERPDDIDIPYKFTDIDLDLPADYSNNSLFIQDAWEVLPSGMQDYVLACLGLSLCFLFLRRS